MSIKPIDLQTLFVKLDDVSREQSVAKEQTLLQQAQAARNQVLKGIQEDHKVIDVPEDRESEAIKDEHPGQQWDERKRKDGNNSRENGDEKQREILNDPDVGQNVDISG